MRRQRRVDAKEQDGIRERRRRNSQGGRQDRRRSPSTWRVWVRVGMLGEHTEKSGTQWRVILVQTHPKTRATRWLGSIKPRYAASTLRRLPSAVAAVWNDRRVDCRADSAGPRAQCVAGYFRGKCYTATADSRASAQIRRLPFVDMIPPYQSGHSSESRFEDKPWCF
jgi:hypothetical protein